MSKRSVDDLADAENNFVWNTLRDFNILPKDGEHEWYGVVLCYMTDECLDYIINGVDSIDTAWYNSQYIEAAEREVMERNLLGKKKLELPHV